jgi:hypothetical protein
MRKNSPAGNYTSRIEEIKEELKTKSLGEAERDRNIFADVGFGTPEFDKLASMEISPETVALAAGLMKKHGPSAYERLEARRSAQ